jgi:hypothetical protein
LQLLLINETLIMKVQGGWKVMRMYADFYWYMK